MAEAILSPSTVNQLADVRPHRSRLFLVGFLVLFLELACIRWFTSYVVFLQFFTNIALLAAFLGMSCGCLAADQKRDWLGLFPGIALATVLVALMTFAGYRFWSGYWSPQESFFDSNYRDPDLANFVVPIEVIAAIFFILIALMFVGLGQVLGRAFEAYPNRILGYTFNIAGSLIGILAFSALSLLQAPPAVWFFVSCAGVALLLHQTSSLTPVRFVLLGALVVGLSLPVGLLRQNEVTKWSPYYRISLDTNSGQIFINSIAHQQMVPFATADSLYSLIYLLQKDSGGASFDDVLVIGSGSGNDVAHALQFGTKSIDAVEIDPVVQQIGDRYHPDHPFQDARVIQHLDDGRHFLRITNKKYDLVVYSKVDSLLLHSSYANIRLESYLFTPEAFEDVRRVLKPDGIFVIYNVFRQDWIVQRIAAMAAQAFGCKPTVVGLPSMLNTLTVTIAGCNSHIADAFAEHKTFWLDPVPPHNLAFNGFSIQPKALPADEARELQQIAPISLTYNSNTTLTSDDWPFLYLHGRLIPDFTVRSMIILGLLGLGMIYLFLPKGRIKLDSRMFFLGAAFMLLETRAVTQIALLFGSTWLVNSSVFFTVLVLIFLANLYVLRVQKINLLYHYMGLMIIIGIASLVPLDVFLAGDVLWRYITPCALSLGPVFFAAVIFARSFRNAEYPQFALGSNIAGSVVGGVAESFSMLTGFQHLLLIAALFYLVSAWQPRIGMTIANS
jgi:SAM-dependent methyltransferase